jgi:predicted peptidase
MRMENQDLFPGNLAGIGVPIWTFHGEKDPSVPAQSDREAVDSVNRLNPVYRAEYTQFPKLGHNIWDIVYYSRLSTETDPDYDPFDMDIYTWMLHYRRVKK